MNYRGWETLIPRQSQRFWRWRSQTGRSVQKSLWKVPGEARPSDNAVKLTTKWKKATVKRRFRSAVWWVCVSGFWKKKKQHKKKNHARLMIEKILTHEYFFQLLVFAPQGSEQELSSSHVSSSNVFRCPLIALMWLGALECCCQPLMWGQPGHVRAAFKVCNGGRHACDRATFFMLC